MRGQFDIFSSRNGYNQALKHFKKVNDILPRVNHENLADLIFNYEQKGEIIKTQIKPIVHALLVDKFEYSYSSYNLKSNITSHQSIVENIKSWQAVEIVLVYYHDQLDVMIINPKNLSHWEKIIQLNKDELLIIYTKSLIRPPDTETERLAIQGVIQVLENNHFDPPESLTRSTGHVRISPKDRSKLKKEPQTMNITTDNMRKTTPKYSVQVTNELFHNGNVEAWKNIIQSYETHFNGSEVYVYFENERINNLNALFKWGKVKNGSMIFFSVSGKNIQSVSKLQRYLFEGASPRFEKFLQKEISKVLHLF